MKGDLQTPATNFIFFLTKRAMGEKSSTFKTCFVTLNIVMLVISATMGGVCLYLELGKDIPVVLEALRGYFNILFAIFCGIGCIALVGLCASCGGCILLVYYYIMKLLATACVIVTIAAFVLLWLSMKVCIVFLNLNSLLET